MTHICYIMLSNEQIAGNQLIASKTREFQFALAIIKVVKWSHLFELKLKRKKLK